MPELDPPTLPPDAGFGCSTSFPCAWGVDADPDSAGRTVWFDDGEASDVP